MGADKDNEKNETSPPPAYQYPGYGYNSSMQAQIQPGPNNSIYAASMLPSHLFQTPSSQAGLHYFNLSGSIVHSPRYDASTTPAQISGDLNLLSQLQTTRHAFNANEVPFPPAPKENKLKSKKEDIPLPPTPPKPPQTKAECVFKGGAEHNDKQEVRKIKRPFEQVLCWDCVWKNFHVEAERIWLEADKVKT